MSLRESRRPLIGWCLFDVANSSYTTLIITVAFNVIFTKLIVGPGPDGSFAHGNGVWAWVLATSWLIAAFLGPWLGALSDAKAWRKRLLASSVGLCATGSLALYVLNPGDVTWAIALVLVSNLGYSLSENFIAAFLPSVARSQEMGRVSGLAWGLGYFGGLASILLCKSVTGLDYRIENYDALRWIGPLTAAFFVVGSLPALLWLKEPPRQTRTEEGFGIILKAIRSLKDLPDLRKILASCFFFQGALAIVISFAAIYGEQVVGMTGPWQAAFFLSLQLSAAGGAFFFGWLQSRWSGLRTLNLTLYIWLVAIALIFGLQDIGRALGLSDLKAPFLLIGNLAGICLGATQSCARALVGQMAPQGREGQIFGLWGFSTKLAMVFALGTFGFLQKAVGLQWSMLFCAVLFSISLLIHRSMNRADSTFQ